MIEKSVIGVDDAIRRIICVANYIEPIFESFKAEWLPDDLPFTIIFSDIGHSLCNQTKKSTPKELKEIWRIIEDLMVRGDLTVREAVATGLLETVLGEASAERFDMALVAFFLGPESIAYCHAWDAFTGVKTQGLY